MNYENAVRRALERVQPDGGTVTRAHSPIDFAVLAPAGTVLVSVIYRHSRDIQMIDLAPLVGSRQLEDATRGLAVANRASSSSVADYIDSAAGHGVMLEFVTWDGPEHGRDFGEALNRLLMPGKIHLTAVGLTSSTL